MSQAASRGIQASKRNSGERSGSAPNNAESVATVNVAAGVAQAVSLADVYEPIVEELDRVQEILRSELQSETPFVDSLLEHSWLMGGKRIRPVFLLLSGASCGEIKQSHLQMAAALEMIHTATLVHDDFLDEAETRRHRETTNAKWGPKISVLLGDYLFTHSFHVASLSGSADALRMLARASNRVCEGEMRQNAWQGNFELTEEQYLRIITEKTAELCGVGCQIGAFLSGATTGLVAGFEKYGRNLGVAFQIIDDVLDIVGSPEDVGKTLGTDLVNQKPTLPVIHCLEHSDPEARSALADLLNDSASTTADLLVLLERTDSVQYARQMAQSHAVAATEFAQSLEPSKYSRSLELLAKFVLARTN